MVKVLPTKVIVLQFAAPALFTLHVPPFPFPTISTVQTAFEKVD
jgi:hypothetical protein